MLYIPILSELLTICSNLEFGLKFTFTISVTDVVDNVTVGYACITTGIYMDSDGHSGAVHQRALLASLLFR